MVSSKTNGNPVKLRPLRVQPTPRKAPDEQPEQQQARAQRPLPFVFKLLHFVNMLVRLPFYLVMNFAKLTEQAYRWELLLHEFVGTFRGGRVSDYDAGIRDETCKKCPAGFVYPPDSGNRYCMGCT